MQNINTKTLELKWEESKRKININKWKFIATSFYGYKKRF